MPWSDNHTLRKERIMMKVYRILRRYGGPMAAKDISANLWDEKNECRNSRSNKYDTASPTTLGTWMRSDPAITVHPVGAGQRVTAYSLKGEEA